VCGQAPEDIVGKDCIGALDLATTTDLAAFLLLFPCDDGFYDLIAKFWCPREGARKRSLRDRVPYEQWIAEGWITATDGDVTDYDVIRKEIQELADGYHIREIAVDRWNATQITTQLGGDGFEMVPFGQGFASMSAPSKELEKLVISKKLRHGNNPVLNWMAANVAIEQDAAGNIKPSKKKSTERIDGIVALVMALGRAISVGPTKASVYEDETRGMLII
jgi:phage terminase large subunit-like protein